MGHGQCKAIRRAVLVTGFSLRRAVSVNIWGHIFGGICRVPPIVPPCAPGFKRTPKDD